MKKLLRLAAAAFLVLTWGIAQAEDIDLFSIPKTSGGFLPNILIVLDNTANWDSTYPSGTAFENEIRALKAVLSSLDANKFRVGLMLYTETGQGDSSPDGSYVRAAIRPMTEANKALYSSMLQSLGNAADKGSARKLPLAMAEAYYYYAGKTAFAGATKRKRDYKGNVVTGYSASNDIYAVAGNAFPSSTSTKYDSPIENGCQFNFIIYIGNSAATGNVTKVNTSDNVMAGAMLAAASGASVTQIPISPSDYSDDYANEWAQWMKSGSGLNITTYAIDVSGGLNGNGLANSALLKSMASEGGGKYFRVDAASSTDMAGEIANDLGKIVSEIQAVNSVFASVSLPVSVNTQGTYLNQVFIGMFRPDSTANPRWTGNLKQYKIGLVGSDIQLQDAASTAAINGRTGFITECARSFWTAPQPDTYWSFKGWPNGTTFCINNAGTSQSSNSPDGNVVEKGAQAYRLRSGTGRNVYTCGSSMAGCADGTTLVGLSSSSLSDAAMGASSAAEGIALRDFVVGLDVDDENINRSVTETRPSVHGDVVHSRPVAINFGGATEATSNVVVFYGANDGLLRAINGNRGDGTGGGAIDTHEPGAELWSFLPPEFFSKIKRLRDNKTQIFYPGETYADGATTARKDYGMDGPITAWTGAIGGATKNFVYATMRRGGRSVYAFDVSAIATNSHPPSLKWRIGCADANNIDCSPGMSGIGQTWSSLKPFKTAGYGADKPLLIFGGGYDACEDYDAGAGGANNNCVAGSKGHSIYVVDADTGALVRNFDTGGYRGVIADVALVRDASGQVILGYAADLGGNVYRLQFGAGEPASWTMKKIASLGCDTLATCPANRKFMFVPSVVTLDQVSLNATYFLMLGSGDREKPVVSYAASYGVTNYFVMLQDKPGVDPATFPGASCGDTVICLSSLLPILSRATPAASQLALKQGWYLGLAPHEQVVTSAVTLDGNVTFSSHQPPTSSADTCKSSLGTTLVYNVDYSNAAPQNAERGVEVAGDGLPPSPVVGQVVIDGAGGNSVVTFCSGCAPTSPLEVMLPKSKGSPSQSKMRLYWYINK